jgi:hypothetical protein
MTAPVPTRAPFGDHGAAPDEGVIFDDDWAGHRWFKDAADTDTTREVDVPADLGAGPDGCPSVDHRIGVHEGADVDIAGHQDNTGRLVTTPARRRARDGTDPAGCEVRLERDLVDVGKGADFGDNQFGLLKQQ